MERYVGVTESPRYTCMEDLKYTENYSSLSPINLEYFGREQCIAGYQFGPYVRECYVIHMITKGKGRYWTKDGCFEVEAGEAFIIYPQEETTYQADEKDPWHYMWIGFAGWRAEKYVNSMGYTKKNPVVTLFQRDRIQEIMDKIIMVRQLNLKNEMLRMSLFCELLSFMLVEEEESKKAKKHEYPSSVYVKYATDYLIENYMKKIKIDELAEQIGISRSYLTSSFKKELNLSPQEFLMNLRMEKAALMLKNTSEPINVIARNTGYEDSMSFSKVFKQKFNMAPKAYRDSGLEIMKKYEKGGYTGKCPL